MNNSPRDGKRIMSAGMHRMRRKHFADVRKKVAAMDETKFEPPEDIAKEFVADEMMGSREEFLEREETREYTISDKGRRRRLMKNEVVGRPRDPVREMHEERKRIFIEQIQGMVRWRKKNGTYDQVEEGRETGSASGESDGPQTEKESPVDEKR